MQEARGEHGAGFSLRVGVNTGEVMAGPVGDRHTVMGTPSTSRRAQAAARPGTVTVGADTHRASRETIAYTRLDPLTLKGKEEPVPAWEATAVLTGPRPAGRDAPDRPPEEAALLASLVDRTFGEERLHLVTVLGQGRRRQVPPCARADRAARRARLAAHGAAGPDAIRGCPTCR